ncbi:hypothetical protein CGLO_15408 [Colletotrichum gloeosporioides Cg-14]|uniref:Uncharacterized protein n=1 Tax=Colletotrichum gloeosporioides (strain Cg-14) TaxID=1237896 RepID=T0LBM0_COLGC|nr:hypothetical protein CGLO_15408 [Colletotrichum gloeosporioides Cg-14]
MFAVTTTPLKHISADPLVEPYTALFKYRNTSRYANMWAYPEEGGSSECVHLTPSPATQGRPFACD